MQEKCRFCRNCPQNSLKMTFKLAIVLCDILFVQWVVTTGTSYSFKSSNLIQDKEHLSKDLSGLVDLALDNISLEHMEFYFFKLHDLDGDQHLDGNELYAALSEASVKIHEESEEQPPSAVEKHLIEAVDSLLEESDENGDGRISWSEYLSKTRNFDKVQEK